MPNLKGQLKELEKCRVRWLEAKRKNDFIMMRLWQKMGEKLKDQIEKAGGIFEQAKEIFK